MPASAGAASPTACKNRTNTTYQALLECVTLEGVRVHQRAFQGIAEANDDPVYPAREQPEPRICEQRRLRRGPPQGRRLRGHTRRVPVHVPVPGDPSAANACCRRPSCQPANGPGGDVTAAVVAVDVALAPPRGHERLRGSRLRRVPYGAIALVRAGPVRFRRRRSMQRPRAQVRSSSSTRRHDRSRDRLGPVNPTLAPFTVGIPVNLVRSRRTTRRTRVDRARVRVETETRTDVNVIAERQGKNTNNVDGRCTPRPEVLGPGISTTTDPARRPFWRPR